MPHVAHQSSKVTFFFERFWFLYQVVQILWPSQSLQLQGLQKNGSSPLQGRSKKSVSSKEYNVGYSGGRLVPVMVTL